MPSYVYDCPTCGRFDARAPMAEAGRPRPCPGCGEPRARVFAAPAFHRDSPLHRALDAQHRSAHAPDVVTAVPPARRMAAPRTDPRQARLPRP